MQRLFLWGLRRYIGGPSRSWLFSSVALIGLRFARSAMGRRELIDVGDVKPGQKIVIEHLPISHKKQIRTFKADDKSSKKAAKAAAKAERRASKEAKAAKRADRSAAREAKTHRRAERRSARKTGSALV